MFHYFKLSNAELRCQCLWNGRAAIPLTGKDSSDLITGYYQKELTDWRPSANLGLPRGVYTDGLSVFIKREGMEINGKGEPACES